MTAAASANVLTDPPLSRASPLPQGAEDEFENVTHRA